MVRAARAPPRAGAAGAGGSASSTLDKQVPTQAGLGGGSADAMAALRLLCDIWRVPPDRDLAGAGRRPARPDIPFFAWGGTASGLGRGDQITPLPALPTLSCAIVRPPFGVPTADAYRWVARVADAGAPAIDAPFDLAVRADQWPERLRRLPQRLRAGRGGAAPGDRRGGRGAARGRRAAGDDVAGSGPAVFGLFEDAGMASRATGAAGGASSAGVAGSARRRRRVSRR